MRSCFVSRPGAVTCKLYKHSDVIDRIVYSVLSGKVRGPLVSLPAIGWDGSLYYMARLWWCVDVASVWEYADVRCVDTDARVRGLSSRGGLTLRGCRERVARARARVVRLREAPTSQGGRP